MTAPVTDPRATTDGPHARQLRFGSGVAGWITRHADRTPDRPALLVGETVVGYGELDRRVWRIAALLRSLGIRRGDRVAVLHDNHVEYLPATLAVLRLGAIYVPLNPRLADAEIGSLIADCRPGLIISQVRYRDRVAAFTAAAGRPDQPGAGPGIAELFTDAADGLGAARWPAADGRCEIFDIDDFEDSAPAGLFYTSGTTGLPKGAIITHGNIRSVATSLAVDIGFGADDRPLISLPVSVSGVMLAGVLPFLHLGCGLRILERSTPADIAEAITRHRPTYMASVPTVFKSLLDHPAFDQVDLTCFQRVLSAAAPMPVSLIERFQQRGLAVFVQGYGLTESCGFSTYLMPEHAISKAGSIGKSLLYSDVRIFSGDAPLPPGEIGEIRVSGPSVMAGYWDRPDERPIVDGWLHTGDLGYADEDGFLYVTGRLKDMIVSGGYNVYPAEVENVLFQRAEVAEAAVVGMPDEHWGEKVVAVLRLHPGAKLDEAAVQDHCRSRLAGYKVPKQVVVVQGPLPINPTGKVVKARIRTGLQDGTLA